MNRPIYRYSFTTNISMTEVRDTLRLAALATQSVFGRQRVLIDADFDLSEADHACWIDASNDVGRHLHQVFRGYVSREFPPHSFTASRVSEAEVPSVALAL